ncbi:MAG: DNA polymerase III subunit beta [Patescibacteria group bacterium]
MKAECTKDKLQQIISRTEKVTGKNLTLPILSCLLLEVKNNTLKVKATNTDLGIESTIPIKTIKEGIVAVPGSVINNLISNIQSDKNVVLESIDGNLQIRTEHSKTLIKSHPFDDFPTIPKVSDGISFGLDSKKLIKGFKAVWFSSSLSSVKPELSSVYVYTIDNDLIFVATDSFRLAEKRIKIEKDNNSFNILIPLKNIPEITRIFEEINGDVDVCLSKNQISFSNNENYIVSRLIDGVFPDYKQIIPNETKTEAIVLKQDLLSVLKISNIFSDKFNQVNVKVFPSKKVFEITTKNSNIGENINTVPASLSGEDISVNFNYKYIIDCLQSIDSDSISLSFNGISKPMTIRGVSDKSFTYIVMPMNK